MVDDLHFTEGETKAQRTQITFPRLQGLTLDLNPPLPGAFLSTLMSSYLLPLGLNLSIHEVGQ